MKLNVTFKFSWKLEIALNNKLFVQIGGLPALIGHAPSVEECAFLEFRYSTINIQNPLGIQQILSSFQ